MTRNKGPDPVARIHRYSAAIPGWEAIYWEHGQDNQPAIHCSLPRDRFVCPKLADGALDWQPNGLPVFEWAEPPVLEQSRDGSDYVSGEYVIIFAYEARQAAGVRTPVAWCRCKDLERLIRRKDRDEPDYGAIARIRHLMGASELGLSQELKDAA